jgi:hypothetical protein
LLVLAHRGEEVSMLNSNMPQFWYARAEQSRKLASKTKNPDLRQILLETAADYEVVATWADASASSPPANLQKGRRRAVH